MDRERRNTRVTNRKKNILFVCFKKKKAKNILILKVGTKRIPSSTNGRKNLFNFFFFLFFFLRFYSFILNISTEAY